MMNFIEKISYYQEQLKVLKIVNDISFEEEMLTTPMIQMCTLRVGSIATFNTLKHKN